MTYSHLHVGPHRSADALSLRAVVAAMLAVAIVAFACGVFLSRVVFCDRELRPAFDGHGKYSQVITYCVIPSTVSFR